MARRPWHMHENGGELVLARRWPARFDLSVETRLPPLARPARLAHQVRQDLWRALRDLRGFSPCVAVRSGPDGITLRAGGQLDGARPTPRDAERIAQVLDDPANRARWARWSA